MMHKRNIKNKILIIMLFAFFYSLFLMNIISYAENIDINFMYGIKNVAKSGNGVPITLRIENKDTQTFTGYLTLNVYENNKSAFIYKVDLDIGPRSSDVFVRDISVSNSANNISISVYNRKEELVAEERTNIDLSYYDNKLVIGAITDDFPLLSYMDNLQLNDSVIQTKLVEITNDDFMRNNKIFDLIDLLVINDVDLMSFDENIDNSLYTFVSSGKNIFIGIGDKNGADTIPFFLNKNLMSISELSAYRTKFDFLDAKIIEEYADDSDIESISIDDGKVICLPYSFNSISNRNDAGKWFNDLLNKSFEMGWVKMIENKSNEIFYNDYYNISNLLNMIDRTKLPDIFVISALLLVYIVTLTIILYVFLRNINKRYEYGKYALIFSILYTFFMFAFGYSIMKKNTFLTYLSIVNIRNENAKETAFLNFTTNESGGYEFDTSKEVHLNPILRNNREPIISLNFMDSNDIKTTTFVETEDRKMVSIENAKDFDSNLFLYENSNYLNDVYSLNCSFRRFDGEVTGRITNNMNITIKDAKLLLFGKILDIGDIEPNHSISLSRAINIGAPIANNMMLANMLAEDINQNIIKYYLDENITRYYDYGLLFGFIDNNGTIEVSSNDVGDLYGRTLLVTRINKDMELGTEDICSLSNDVNNIEGYYDYELNTINGDEEVVNEYSFDVKKDITKLYFEGIDYFDNGRLDSSVPFYGDISIYNYMTNNYDLIESNEISSEKLSNYLTPDNKVIIKFSPKSLDPLYRTICLPILRAIVS